MMLMQSHLLKGLIFSILFISSYAQYEVESPSAPANQGTEVKISGNQPLQNKEFIYSPTLAPTNNKYMPPPELYVPKGAAPGTEPAAHDNSNGEFIHAATEQQGIDASRSSSSAKSGPPANIKFTLRNLGQDDDTLANFYGDYIAGFNPRHVASASSSTTTSSSLSTSSSTHQSKTGLAQSSSPSWSTLEHASTSNVHPNVNTGSVANGLSAESGDSTNTQPKPSSSQSSQSNSGNGSSSESNRPGSTSSSSLNNISPSGLPPTGSLSGNKITSSEEHKQSSSSSQGETTANKSSSESSATFHAEIDSKSEKQSTDSHTISNIGDLLRTAHPGAKPEDIDIISKAGLLGLDDIEERLKAIKCNEGEEHLESQSHLEPIPQQKIAPEIIDTTKQSSISENNPDTHSIIEETETPATLIDESDGNGHKTAPKESNHQNETDNTKERENSKGTISSPSPPAEKVTQPHLVEVSPSPATLATVDTQQYVKPSATSNVQKIALPNQVEIKNELEKVPLISSSSNALPQSVATSSSGEKALPETFVPPSTVVEKVAPESVSSRTASPQVIPSSTIKASPEDVPSAPKSALPQVIAPSSHADEKIVPEEVSSVTASPPSPSTDIKGKPEIVPSQTALPESTAPSSSIGKISLPESVPYITPTAMSESFVPSVNEKTLSKNVPSLTPKSVVGLLPKGGSSETVSVLEITLTDKSASPSSVGEKTKPESSSVSESIAPESTVPSAAGEKTLPQESSVTSSYVGEKTMPESTITSVSENVSPKSSVPSSSGNAIAESIPSVTKTALPETTATEGKTENVPSTNDEKASPEKIPSIAKTASLQTPASSSSIDEIGLPSISKPALPNTISETIPSASAHSIDTANKLSANTASPSHTILPSTSSKPTINHNTDSILVASITPKHPSSSSSESKETSHKNKSSSSSSEESKPKKEGHGHLTSVTSVPDSLRIPIAPQLPSSIKEVMPEIHPSQITPQIKPSLSEIASTEVRPSQVTPEYIPYVSEITPQITPEVKLPISEITPELPSSVSIPRIEPPVSEVAPEVQPPLSEIAPETHHNLIEISPPTHPSSTEPHSSKIEAFPESPNPSPIESEKVTTSTAAPSSIAYNTPQILVAQTTTQASLSIAQVSTTQATIVIESSNNNIVIVSTQVPASAINHETLAPITAPVAIPTIPTAPHIFVPTKPTKNEGEIKVVEITKLTAIPPSSQLTPTENKPSTGNKHVGDIIHPSPSEEIHVVAHNSPYISPKNAIGIASKNAIDTSSNIAPSTAITVDHNNIDHSNVDHNNVGTNNIISPSTSRSSVEAPDVLRPSEISAFDKDTAVTASISDKYDTHSEIASPSSVHIVPESHLGNKITSDNAQSNTEASTHKTPSPRVFAPHSAPVNVPVPPPHPSIHKTEPYAQHFSSEVVPTTHEETGERTEQTSEHHVPIITSKSESHEEKQVYTPAVVPQVTKEVNSQERPTSIIETSQIQMKPTEESYTENLTPPVEKSLPIKPIQIESPEPDQTHSVAIPAKPVSLPEESGNEVVPNQDLTHSSETHLNTKTGSSNEEHPTETGSHLEEEFSNQSNYGSANAQKKGGDVVVQKVVEATKETVYKPTNNGNTHNTYHEKTITHSVEPSQIISEVPHQEKSDENRGEEPEAPQSRSEGRTGYEKVIANTETHVSQQVVPQQNTFNPRTTSQIDSTQVQIVPAPEVVETTNTQVQPEQPDQSQQQVSGGSNAGYSQQQGSNYGVAPQNIVYPQQQAQSYQQPQAPSNYGNNYNSGYQSRPQSQPGCCGGNWLSRQGGICAPISNSPCGGIPASPRAPCSIGSNCYSAAPQPAFPPYSSPCQRPCGGCSQPAPRSCCCTPAAPNPLAGFPNLFGSLCTGRKKRSLTWSGICGRYVAAK